MFTNPTNYLYYRLDCIRKISKGKADFSVFTAEDLVTASNSKIEILITNEMRLSKGNVYLFKKHNFT